MSLNKDAVKSSLACYACRVRKFLIVCFSLTLCLAGNAQGDSRTWQPIAQDGLRDPQGPAVRVLQPPGDALRTLAPDSAGNLVRWPVALREKQISPRDSLHKAVNSGSYDEDVFLNLNGGMPAVRFPHTVHNAWLDCSNCHDHLFKKKRGASGISMFLILQGEQCGVCHGAVAFPLTECSRCHSMTRDEALAALAEQDLRKAQATSMNQAPPPANTTGKR